MLIDQICRITTAFVYKLKNAGTEILGDFFEVWVGDDYVTELARSVATKLKAISDSGIPVYFIHGNRDFILREHYANLAGMTLLDEQTVIDLYGTPTVILHGAQRAQLCAWPRRARACVGQGRDGVTVSRTRP